MEQHLRKQFHESASNQMEDEKKEASEEAIKDIGSLNSGDKSESFRDTLSRKISQDEKIPEFQDIYDYIYGNVKTKKVFYENNWKTSDERPQLRRQSSRTSSICLIPEEEQNKRIKEEDSGILSESSDVGENLSDSAKSLSSAGKDCSMTPPSYENSTAALINDVFNEIEDVMITAPENLENSLKKNSIIDERMEILTEINTNLSMDLTRARNELKLEMAKNTQLNFEIANIESILETYYKESCNQKSAFSSLYSAVKVYIKDEKSLDKDSYTFKRIKAIANYVENLKNKFTHQDRIIKNNFIENPYYSDLMIRHEYSLKQLDAISLENQVLKESLSSKEAVELETIKELNRQKFLLESKCDEIEQYYRDLLAQEKENMKRKQMDHEREMKELEICLVSKDREMTELKASFTAKASIYEQELTILYGKWNQMKIENDKLSRRDEPLK